jgi:hypothetical protein
MSVSCAAGRLQDHTGLEFLTELPAEKRKTELNVSGELAEWK